MEPRIPSSRVTFGKSLAHHGTFAGTPAQGEDNVWLAVETFVAVLNRDWSLGLLRAQDVSGSPNEYPGVDACAVFRNGRYLSLQVVRAMPSNFYQEQAHAGLAQSTGGLDDAATYLRRAIERKTSRAASPSITLLIDGTAAPQLALFAPTVFVEQHGAWASALDWESIWVVGPSSANRLDLEVGEVCLPHAWIA